MPPSFPDPESVMADDLRAFIDSAAFGEILTVYTDTFDGYHPDEGTPMWVADTTGTEVSGRVQTREQTKEYETVTGEEVSGEFFIYVSSDVTIQDGRTKETEDSSRVVDEDGNSYEIQFVEDMHNGLYRCVADLEVGE